MNWYSDALLHPQLLHCVSNGHAGWFPAFSHFCATSLPVGPGLLCKLMKLSGSDHYSGPSHFCTTYWIPERRRRLLDWKRRMTLSRADKKEVCETWSPSRIACCERRARNPKILLHDGWEVLAESRRTLHINYFLIKGKKGPEVTTRSTDF